MAPGDVLSVGRQLVVWTNGDVAPQAAANTDRIRRLTYTVRRGDSLSGISTRFRVSVGELARWNVPAPAGFRKLIAGKTLWNFQRANLRLWKSAL